MSNLKVGNLNISRRVIECYQVPVELAINKAILEIEKLSADPELTNALLLLSQAKEKVSDFIDKNIHP